MPLIGPFLLLLALGLTLALVLGPEHRNLIFQGLAEGHPAVTQVISRLWQSPRNLIVQTVLLVLVSGIGITAVITLFHYHSTQRTLEEVKGLARNILKSIPIGVLTIDRHGIITAVNPAAEAVLNRAAADLLGHAYEAVFSNGEMIREVLDNALRRCRHVSQHDLQYDAGRGAARTIRVTTARLTGDDGEPAGVILLAQDVTDWLILEQRIHVAEKLAALHTLSAGLAHELRNPLSAMDLNLHLLEEELRDKAAIGEPAAHYLRIVNAECRRLSVILDNFMKFARPGAVGLRVLDIAQLIQHIVALMQLQAEERKVRLEFLAEGLPPILGDETELSQVLVNIIVNAFQAMPGGGLCRITAAPCQLDGNTWVEIAVQDTGVGIEKENLARVFEPFYSTKSTGSGLGLAIAYRIIHDHGGTIRIASAPGEGTTVIITLPAAGRFPSPVTGEA